MATHEGGLPPFTLNGSKFDQTTFWVSVCVRVRVCVWMPKCECGKCTCAAVIACKLHSTTQGRFKYFLEFTDTRMLLTSDAEIQSSVALLDEYKNARGVCVRVCVCV
jgi:hypothetical protein